MSQTQPASCQRIGPQSCWSPAAIPRTHGEPSDHGRRDRAHRPCVWGATGARLGQAGRRGVGGQQGRSDLPGTNGPPSSPTPAELQLWGECPAPRMPTSQRQFLTRRACSGPSPRNKGKVKGREVARAEREVVGAPSYKGGRPTPRLLFPHSPWSAVQRTSCWSCLAGKRYRGSSVEHLCLGRGTPYSFSETHSILTPSRL